MTRRLLLTVCSCLAFATAVPYVGIGAAAHMRKYADFRMSDTMDARSTSRTSERVAAAIAAISSREA